MKIKEVAKSILAVFPWELGDKIRLLNNRIRWKRAEQHLKYFEDFNTRRPFVVALKELLDGLGTSEGGTRILEFGCSGGNNLRLLREVLAPPVHYCGVDINPKAIAFAREKFPDAIFHVASDADLFALMPRLGHFDVFLMSGVLYYLPRNRAQAVLNLAASVADYTLVCDDLTRFSEMGGNAKEFLHPYATLCREAGLVVIVPPTRMRLGDRHSYFIARSAKLRPSS